MTTTIMSNFDMPPALKAFLKWAGQTIGTLAVFGVAATYWINTEVERRMTELATNPEDSPVIAAAIESIDNLETATVRIEGKVDTFSTEFTKYLQRQIELAEEAARRNR